LRARAERLLGQFLFAYAKLETALDLCLASVDEGRNFDERAKILEDASFFKKLELLNADACCSTPTDCTPAYTEWVRRSHALRVERNILVHGRVGFDVIRGIVIVVSSRATSKTLVSDEYSLAELEQVVGEAERLTHELNILRSTWPL
jgi:hypothetical protein